MPKATFPLSRSVSLIGMSGVGKSTIGRELSKAFKAPFIDVDDVIREQTGKELQESINEKGDDGFIHIEEAAILSINPADPTIIATGGSVVYSDNAMTHLKGISTVIYLKDDFKRIFSRVKNAKTRGIVGLRDRTFEELYHEREALYNDSASIIVHTGASKSKKDTVEQILRLLKDHAHVIY